MKVSVISTHLPQQKMYNFYQSNTLRNNSDIKTKQFTSENKLSFKSDKGAAVGMVTGALVGIGAAAFIIATGGLGAAVAAVGVTGVTGAGAGLGAQVGGIIGGFATKEKD